MGSWRECIRMHFFQELQGGGFLCEVQQKIGLDDIDFLVESKGKIEEYEANGVAHR